MKKKDGYIVVLCILGAFTLYACGDDDKDNGNENHEGDSIIDTDTDTESESLPSDTDTGVDDPLAYITITQCEEIPTVAIVEWPELEDVEPTEIEEAYIEYGRDKELGMRAPVDLSAKKLRTLLLGMKGDQEGPVLYYVRSTLVVRGEKHKSQMMEFETGWLPTDLPSITEEFRLSNNKLAKGFYVTVFYGAHYAAVIDTDGDYVWWHKVTGFGAGAGTGGSDANMDWSGRYLYAIKTNNDFSDGMINRFSIDGSETVLYKSNAKEGEEPEGDDFIFLNAHHSLAALPEGGVAFISRTDGDCDEIYHLEENGTVTWLFRWSDYFEFDNECHTNYIHYDQSGDAFVLSSLRNDTVIYVDREGNLLWAVGRDEFQTAETIPDWMFGKKDDFASQHGVYTWDSGKNLLLFNNRIGTGNAGIYEYRFNDELSEAEEVWSYAREGAGSTNLGNVQRLPNGNTLIAYSTDGVLNQVNSKAKTTSEEVIQRMEFSDAIGYVTWRDSLYGPPQL